MRTLVAAAVLCLACAVAGCSDPVRAPLDVNWSFGGLDCDQVGVATIHLQMDRELLNPSDYSCFDGRGNVVTGAHLGNFLLGDYNVTVVGLDSSGTEILRGTRTAHVARGDNLVDVDISGSVTFRWAFNGQTCAQAQVSFVNLSVDGNIITDAAGNPNIPCTQAGQDAAQISPLLPGPHIVDIVGLVRGAPSYLVQDLPFNVQDLVDTNQPVNLPLGFPTVGTADVFFSFAGGLTCEEAQVDSVQEFIDVNADGSGGTPVSDPVPCTALSGPVKGLDADEFDIAPGTHSFSLDAFRGNVLVYTTTQPPAALFVAGLRTNIAVDAASVAPAIGAANLTWDFGSAGVFCSGGTWSLTDPAGNVIPQPSATCAGGRTGVLLDNLTPGLWTFDGTAFVNGVQFRSTTLFGVPNEATNNFRIPFTR